MRLEHRAASWHAVAQVPCCSSVALLPAAPNFADWPNHTVTAPETFVSQLTALRATCTAFLPSCFFFWFWLDFLPPESRRKDSVSGKASGCSARGARCRPASTFWHTVIGSLCRWQEFGFYLTPDTCLRRSDPPLALVFWMECGKRGGCFGALSCVPSISPCPSRAVVARAAHRIPATAALHWCLWCVGGADALSRCVPLGLG